MLCASATNLTRIPTIINQKRNFGLTACVIGTVVDICTASTIFAFCEYANLFSARKLCHDLIQSPKLLRVSDGI